MSSNILVRKAAGVLDTAGAMASVSFEGLRNTWRVSQWWDEFLLQAWFLVSVTALPVFLISIPLGATISLQVGDLARQLGAQSSTGAIIAVGVVREAAPIATAVLIAGAGGSAIAADMGSRRIRDELDAMDVMGINPIHRLVTPRIWAAVVTGMLLVSLVIVSGVGGGYFFNVIVQGVTPGAYFAGVTSLLQIQDLGVAIFKAGVFGFLAAVVACAQGMNCDTGPVGVGRAVNRAVVNTFVLLFGANYVISSLYLVLVPQKL